MRGAAASSMRATVSLPQNAKVGLVGRNGIGKSTLFKLIMGELTPGGGDIGIPRNARVGQVAQEHPATPVTLLETVLEDDLERHDLLTSGWKPPSRRRWARSGPA